MKHYIKVVAQLTSLILVYPVYFLLRLCNLFFLNDLPFQGFSQLMSLFPGVPGNYLRQQFYRLSLAECSNDCCIEFGTFFSQMESEIGQRVYIGANCSIGLSRIGDDVMLGSNVDIVSGKNQHYFESLDTVMREQGGQLEQIDIGQDCWLGNNSVVMASIGTKSIVAAGSVVIKDVPPYSIVGGNPARVLKNRKDINSNRPSQGDQ